MASGSRDTTSGTGFTRRRLVAGAAVGVAAAAAPLDAAVARAERGAEAARRGGIRQADVVVVGAGLAGLTAARAVARARKSVVVVEAQSRVGGRVLNQPIGGGRVTDGGAAFVGPTQDRILALARQLRVGTHKTYNTGKNVYYRNGRRQTYSGLVPPDPTGAADVARALADLDQMAAQVPVDGPWRAPRAGDWDGQTLQTWADSNLTTEGGRFLLGVAMEPLLGTALGELSLLFALWYAACAGNETTPGNFDRLFNTGGGAQDSHFRGGAGLIPERMAAQLGRRVILGAPVRRIVQTGRLVGVESDRISLTAKRVIVAVPPVLAHQIEYEPRLPPAREQLTQRMPMGVLLKISAVYDKPFWREQGFTGQAVSDTGPGRTTFDTSPPDGSVGVLLAFVGADDARAWQGRPAGDLFQAVLRSFARYFGDQALRPIGSAIMPWPLDPWARGGPTAFTPPAALTRYGTVLTEPVGKIHWAGSETATYWRGYMDGAVRSGERAAKEVLAKL
jgi:monoamine oxidase